MSRTEFFKALRKALRWTFNADEITDILSDYEGFFETGKGGGKDEAQICAELGDPSAIARELAEELEKKRVSPLWVKIFVRMLLAVAVGIFSYFLCWHGFFHIDNYHFNIVLYVTLVAVFWGLLIGATSKMPSVAIMPHKIWKWSFIICHFILAGIVITDYIIYSNALLDFLSEGPRSIPWELSSYYYSMYPLLTFLPMLITILSVYCFYRAGPQWFTVISHALGTSVYFWTVINVLRDVSDPSALPRLEMLVVYGVSVVAAALLALYIRKYSRRAN